MLRDDCALAAGPQLVTGGTLRSEGNLNNEIGLPLTLLRLLPEHERAVLEMGMYAPGEISQLVHLARPRIGVVTAIEPDGDAVVLTINGRATRWPAHAEATLRRALSLPRFTLAALGDEIDLRGRLTLARKLVVEGALRVEAL